MHGRRSGRALVIGFPGRRSRGAVGLIAGGRMGVLLWLLVVLVLVVAPAVASAEALCTDTWTGPSKGNWMTAGDWSGGVPSSAAVACVGVGDTVEVSEGANATGVLQGKGALVVRGGSLEVASAIEVSGISALELQTGGTLTGAGALEVSGSLTWHGGTMSGSGKTVIAPGASGAAREALLTERRLVNQGTFTLESPSFRMADHAVLQNEAKTVDNSEGGASIEVASGSTSAPLIANTGIFEKTERDIEDGSTTAVAVPVENLGTVKSLTGFLEFSDGGSSNATADGRAREAEPS